MFEDLSVFFNTNEFAISFQYTEKIYSHPSANTIRVVGIFMNRYVESGNFSGTRPVLTCESRLIPNASRGDFIRIDSVDYTLQTPEPDGTGLVKIILEKINGNKNQ